MNWCTSFSDWSNYQHHIFFYFSYILSSLWPFFSVTLLLIFLAISSMILLFSDTLAWYHGLSYRIVPPGMGGMYRSDRPTVRGTPDTGPTVAVHCSWVYRSVHLGVPEPSPGRNTGTVRYCEPCMVQQQDFKKSQV